MSASLALLKSGLVTSVGLCAPAACAAIRAKLTNPVETRFFFDGERLQAHEVPLEQPVRGLDKLARMAAMAIEEALAGLPRECWEQVPLLLCVAERERPGRLPGLDDGLFLAIQGVLGGVRFAPQSGVIPHGRVGVAIALTQARKLILESRLPQVLIVATDSLLTSATLKAHRAQQRLLNPGNSNGFIPGEGAGALLFGHVDKTPRLAFCGVGFGVEHASIERESPLRADGLCSAIRNALNDAGCQLHDLDFRITDLAGEHYYFKEAALALTRLLRQRKEAFELWHPAESIGESGALAGVAAIAQGDHACRNAYAPGRNFLVHLANDAGARAAAVFAFGSA